MQKERIGQVADDLGERWKDLLEERQVLCGSLVPNVNRSTALRMPPDGVERIPQAGLAGGGV